MKFFPSTTFIFKCLAPSITLILWGCEGIFSGIYDEPASETRSTDAGHLYIDASDWEEWHYIDLKAVEANIEANSDFNTSSLWQTFRIPLPEEQALISEPRENEPGIYNYWYDVFDRGLSNHEFRGFTGTEAQPEPENWTFAVHRNNVRTNGCLVAETSFTSLSEMPDDTAWLSSLSFCADEWNQTDVWTVQERMLNGIVGNQGIHINPVLSRWLKMVIPPMPPVFEINRHVFVVKLPDGSFAALHLENYLNSAGLKCCLSINYKYPL